jgi:hypothetical protein
MKKVYITALALVVTTAAFGVVPSHWDGGRNTPVHKLALRDEFGDKIDPASSGALPVSTRKTCGQCHDYETIASGWHFNSSSTNSCPGRASEPWFLIDKNTGSQIPMSMRSWKGVYKPADLDMTNWEWTYAFGRHMPGGDLAEPADIYAEGGPKARWEVSGKLEVNCFACHSRDKLYDHSEYVRLISRENFAWASSGALGLGYVGGMGSRVPDYWDALKGLGKDDKVYRVPPHIKYDMRKFDFKSRTVLDVGAPRNENCLNCHSVSQAGMDHEDIDGDVHLRAGMACTDCHSNGLKHDIVRGYEGEKSACMGEGGSTASCVGCHNGTDETKAGRFGAPAPKHIGIPLVHFEKLNCTVCHSGVTTDGQIAQVRTSKANRMGVYGRAIWVTPAPFILEPVFVKNDAGKIEPRRMSWPAFWGTCDADGKVAPIKPELVNELCSEELSVREQVGALLQTLATDANHPGDPALAIDGLCYAANADYVAVPVEKDDSLKGVSLVYLVEGTNNIAVIPEYDPVADTEKMSDAQYEMHADNQVKFGNLLQTLDASPLAENRYGAVVIGDKIYYRGGPDEAVISTNAPAGVATKIIGFYDHQNFTALITDYIVANVKELGDSECSLTESMVAAGLKKLTDAGQVNPVYIAHGKLWNLDSDGTLVASEDDAAAPVSWAIGHDVRPARMARGAKPIKCADCHTAGSDFFFTDVKSTGPMLTANKMVQSQISYMGLSNSYHKLFGLTFTVRPVLKIFLWIVFALLSLIAVAFAAAGIPALLALGGLQEGSPKEKLMAKVDNLSYLGILAASAYLCVSGLGGWFFHLMSGYLLIMHIMAGGLFAVCLLSLIWTRGAARIVNSRKSWLWMILETLGVIVIFTAVAPMMTIFGSGWQDVLLQAHRYSTICFLTMGVITLVCGKK